MILLVPAQLAGSLGVAATAARFADGTSFSSAAVAPALEIGAPAVALSFGGTMATLATSQVAAQAGGSLWATTALTGPLRLGVQAGGSGVSRPGSRTAVFHGMADLMWDRGAWGVAAGAGPSSGWIAGAAPVTTLHLRARAWQRVGATTVTASVEPVRWFGSWFVDQALGAGTGRGAARLGVSLLRRSGPAATPSVGGGAQLQVFPRATVAVELAAGSALRDPWQGLPRVSYASAGIRLYRVGGTPHAAPPSAAPARPQPLVLARQGDSVAVRFRMPGATAVAIAGDWDGWREHPLAGQGGDIFSATLPLAAGRWRFDLLVDGEWVVPEGIATRREPGGGLVAILLAR